MTVPRECCAIVWRRYQLGHACRNMGSVERAGRWYCGIHDPEKKAGRQKAQPKIRGGAS
jgi:hypothetical protein